MDEAEYCDRIGLIYRGELIALGTPERLKTDLMQDEILEVLCERPQDAMGKIEELDNVKEVALFGRGLHVVTEESARVIPQIEHLLKDLTYKTTRIEQITPSLEDVFVSLIEAHDRAGHYQQEVKR
jgi:ABC-2 type transport system ATP-binding protein